MVLKSKQLNTFFQGCQFFFSERQNLHDDLCLTYPSYIGFGEEFLLNALLYGSDSVLQNKFLRFNIPFVIESTTSRHDLHKQSSRVFYKVFFKFLQNSQQNSCSGVYFSCHFNKKEGLAQVVSCEFSEIGLTPKYKKHMFANVS